MTEVTLGTRATSVCVDGLLCHSGGDVIVRDGEQLGKWVKRI